MAKNVHGNGQALTSLHKPAVSAETTGPLSADLPPFGTTHSAETPHPLRHLLTSIPFTESAMLRRWRRNQLPQGCGLFLTFCCLLLPSYRVPNSSVSLVCSLGLSQTPTQFVSCPFPASLGACLDCPEATCCSETREYQWNTKTTGRSAEA
ncbi:hypothetical protein FA13DRAFT_1260160 [Coprinellus micaceus]|uniref:Uncharacterized protein n=1 Tax=Coprinellus micaceus TaxID=71717 RepID=A0A4Y7ST52_COPMI|nr:hypothetical protein FA13DRAFT_1260160 [Coprinellus micaceus]